MGKVGVALQMYTVRDVAGKDYIGTLKKVAEIGYRALEIAGGHNLSATELKKVLDDLGMKVVGAHVGGKQLTDDLNATVDYYKELNNKYLVTSGLLNREWQKTEQGWRDGAKQFEDIGRKLADRGMAFAYHNHSFEFVKFGNKFALDLFYESSDPRFVKAEIDVYWVKHGNDDPAAFLKRHGGRAPLIHAKDMLADEKRSFAEVGVGILDWPGIFKACEASAAEWYIVEQDTCQRPTLESARISFESLKKWGKV